MRICGRRSVNPNSLQPGKFTDQASADEDVERLRRRLYKPDASSDDLDRYLDEADQQLNPFADDGSPQGTTPGRSLTSATRVTWAALAAGLLLIVGAVGLYRLDRTEKEPPRSRDAVVRPVALPGSRRLAAEAQVSNTSWTPATLETAARELDVISSPPTSPQTVSLSASAIGGLRIPLRYFGRIAAGHALRVVVATTASTYTWHLYDATAETPRALAAGRATNGALVTAATIAVPRPPRALILKVDLDQTLPVACYLVASD